MYRRARVLLWLVLAFCLLSTVHASSKDDDDWECDAKCMMDILNLVMFVFAGGPEEVVPRLILLVVTTIITFLVLALVAAICSCCGIDPERPRGRRRQRREPGPLEYAVTGHNFFQNMKGFANTAHLWF